MCAERILVLPSEIISVAVAEGIDEISKTMTPFDAAGRLLGYA
jgi:hypothetical protein